MSDELAAVLARVGDDLLPDMPALEAAVAARERIRVQTLNLFHVTLIRRDPRFREATLQASAWTADGWPLSIAFRIMRRPVSRTTGRELCRRLVSDARFLPSVRKVALVGGTDEAGDRLSRALEAGDRALVVRVHGPVAEWDMEAIASLLAAQSPDLVLVAVTPPTGEIVAARLFELLPSSSSAFVGVGGAVDMAVGIVKPTPESVSRSGLEWAWRLMLEPRRMWRRYLRDGLPTMAALLLAAWRARASTPPEPRSPSPHEA